ncbi:YvcK family protein [Candidatus Amesbacteria bacterium]|nr:YvcK family protein [Candidatus Amesbacteria bacterium]
MAKPQRLVTLGGGTGAPVVIQSLLLAGFKDITAITASMDSGGRTGHLRSDERDRVIAVSDLLRTLLSLIPPRSNHLSRIAAFTSLAEFTDGRNRNLGYTLYYALLEKYRNDFSAVQKHLEQLLDLHFSGTAIPVTLQPTHIHFSTTSGQQFIGEHELDRQSMSKNTITDIWLDPQVPATPQALAAITSASHIIYCPGSLYGSIIANFLPFGITTALHASRARKILISNLVSTRNQTHKFTPADYLHVFQKYTRLKKPFDIVVSPHLSSSQFTSQFPRVSANYDTEHSYFLGLDHPGPQPKDTKIIREDIFSITPHLNRIRHDSHKLARVLRRII